jgi:hypothetical protein
MTGGAGIILWLVIWTGMVMLFDSFIGLTLWRQLQASHFPQTQGVITHSEIARKSGSDGSTYIAEISFEYEVNGEKHEGDTYRFGAVATSNRGDARKITQRFKKGASVPVYYDPAYPDRAVLIVGLEGGDLFLLTFMLPFNAVMVGGWFAVVRYWLIRGDGPGGLRRSDEPGRIGLRFIPSHPLISAIIAAGVGGFISMFIIAFSRGFNPSIELMRVVWFSIGCVALLAMSIHKIRNLRHPWMLELDPARRILLLPSRAHGDPISFDQVRSIDVRESGHSGNGIYTYYPVVQYVDRLGKDQFAWLPVLASRERATEFVEWLRESVGLKQPANVAVKS